MVAEINAQSCLEPAGRSSEAPERGLEPAGRGWKPARRASELAGRSLEQAGRGWEPAWRESLGPRWKGLGASWEGQMDGQTKQRTDGQTERLTVKWLEILIDERTDPLIEI